MTTLDPIHMIGNLNAISNKLAEQLDSIRAVTTDITSQWDGICKAGGAREDHAATLMTRLVPSLQSMSAWCDICTDQIRQMNENPFGD